MESSDAELLRELYDASYRRLVGQLSAVTGSVAEAEDVVQEAFVRAVRHRRKLASLDNPEAWLRRVAVNIARSRWRRTQHWLRLSPRLVDRAPSPELSPDSIALLDAMRQLPLAQREVIALHHLGDLSVREVARQLDVPEGTVKARLSRGRNRLAELLGDPPAIAEESHG